MKIWMMAGIAAGVMLSGQALAGDKEQMQLGLHATRCMGVPNLKMADTTAQAMKLQKIQEEGETKSEGYYLHMKSWLIVDAKQGPFMWSVMEGWTPNKGFVANCSVAAVQADAGALQSALKLGKPDHEENPDVGVTIRTWKRQDSTPYEMQILDGNMGGQPMVMLTAAYNFAEKPKGR